MMQIISKDVVHVAVGVVIKDRKILVAQRPPDVHLAGFWEFPGGKIETGESVVQAVIRELREELGILVESAIPFLEVHHRYPEKNVLLHVCLIEKFGGQATPCEQQILQWISFDELSSLQFPPANVFIVKKIVERYCT